MVFVVAVVATMVTIVVISILNSITILDIPVEIAVYNHTHNSIDTSKRFLFLRII